MLYKPEVSSTVIVTVIILMIIMMIMGEEGWGGNETSCLETKKTLPLKPASGFLLLPALNHFFQTADSWAEILFTLSFQ